MVIQETGLFRKMPYLRLMSFVNTTKYPVSLLYTLMTLGPVLIIMAWMENWKTNLLEPARIVGRVPLFYYILHFYLIHFTSLCVFMITTGTPWSDVNFHFPTTFGGIPAGTGYRVGLGLRSMAIHCCCVVSCLQMVPSIQEQAPSMVVGISIDYSQQPIETRFRNYHALGGSYGASAPKIILRYKQDASMEQFGLPRRCLVYV